LSRSRNIQTRPRRTLLGSRAGNCRWIDGLPAPNLADGFSLDILVANFVAAFLLGLVAALRGRQLVSEGVYMLVGTGICRALSTFSSFAFGMAVLTNGVDSKRRRRGGLHGGQPTAGLPRRRVRTEGRR
jgi:hypothetical protein